MTGELAGFTVAVTIDRRRDELAALLERQGARVVATPALRLVPLAAGGPGYRWSTPADLAPLRRLVFLVTNRLVDAITFTATPAIDSLLHAAGPDVEAVLAALRTDVLAACVGPLVAAPLHRHRVPVLVPGQARLGALVRAIAAELPRRVIDLQVAGHRLTLRGHVAVLDGTPHSLAPAPMTVLRALAGTPGRVLTRAALLHSLPRGSDGHTVEMAVARLRATLRVPGMVQTVLRRGYRLAID
ncbi:uroporphyrinogen-III synthase [Micromonospora sp. NPDC003197]